jgi:long-chain acyl-CoA synthetase
MSRPADGAGPPSWLIDVDATLIDGVSGSHLRPNARRLLELLRERGVRVHLWSSGGADYALRRARQHAVDHLVDDTFSKRRQDPSGPWELPAELRADPPVVLVDDVPDEVPTVGEVVRVRPFLGPNPYDDGLAGLFRLLGSDPP